MTKISDSLPADQSLRTDTNPLVFISLGSNLGHSMGTVRAAMSRLQDHSRQPIRRSSLWRSTPVDCPPGSPSFVNAVVGLTPRDGETPEGLLAKLQSLEREYGREPKKELNEPRTLDLDLIAWGKLRQQTGRLTLPHPRAHQRRFVLAPLSEIDPDFVLPGQSVSVGQLLRGLDSDEDVVRIAPPDP